MNAVEAVEAIEQLTVLGKRVQARTQRLQQPVAALQFSPPWEQMLADPLALLEALLAPPYMAPQPQPAPPARTGSFRLLEPSVPPAFAGQTPAEEQQASEQSRLAQPSPAHPLAHPPPGGMRLARRQSSLLGILSANVGENMPGATDRNAASQGRSSAPAGLPGGVQAAQDGAQREDGAQARWEDATGAPASDGEAQTYSPALYGKTGEAPVRSSRWQDAPQPAPANTSSLNTQAQQSAQQTGGWEAAPWQGRPLQRTSVGLARDSREFIRSAPVWPSDDASNLQTPIQTLPPLAPAAAAYSSAHPLIRSSAESPPDDSVWANTRDASAERLLSLAQIEQVLAALDERLELMLLRMYGSSGSR